MGAISRVFCHLRFCADGVILSETWKPVKARHSVPRYSAAKSRSLAIAPLSSQSSNSAPIFPASNPFSKKPLHGCSFQTHGSCKKLQGFYMIVSMFLARGNGGDARAEGAGS